MDQMMMVASKKRELKQKLHEAVTLAMAIAGSTYIPDREQDKYRQVVSTLMLLENNTY